MNNRYWENKTLAQMNAAEWDALCDGCALCCINKIEDVDDGELYYTNTACELLDLDTCRCSDYANRAKKVATCLQLTVDNVERYDWLPKSCAYRRLANGKPLPDWHPLLTGRAETVHEAGISLLGELVQDENDPLYNVFQLLEPEDHS